MIGFLLALFAFIIEVIHWVSTRDSDILFYALVLTTLAILVGPAVSFVQSRGTHA